MKNIDSIISAHNQNILNAIFQSYGCNCRVESRCPLNGECLTPKIIYRANDSNDANRDQRFYLVLLLSWMTLYNQLMRAFLKS